MSLIKKVFILLSLMIILLGVNSVNDGLEYKALKNTNKDFSKDKSESILSKAGPSSTGSFELNYRLPEGKQDYKYRNNHLTNQELKDSKRNPREAYRIINSIFRTPPNK
jgi:hypothetical protein